MSESHKMAEMLELYEKLSRRQRARVRATIRDLLYPTLDRVDSIIRSESVLGDYKMCPSCRTAKVVAVHFYKDRSKPDGFMYDCIACTHEKRGKKRRACAA